MKVSNAQRQPKGKQMHHYQTTNWRLIKSQMVFFTVAAFRDVAAVDVAAVAVDVAAVAVSLWLPHHLHLLWDICA